jgi:hypothetical protein
MQRMTRSFGEIAEALRSKGIKMAEGLTALEFEQIEADFGFVFPPDLRRFLTLTLPVSEGWADWRGSSKEQLLEQLNWPLEGILFDVEHGDFWMPSWGEKPADLQKQKELVRKAVASAPTLIPVCFNRYLPAEPNAVYNPVLSVHQTDIIVYGRELGTYLVREFELFNDFLCPASELRRIDFWFDIMENGNSQ